MWIREFRQIRDAYRIECDAHWECPRGCSGGTERFHGDYAHSFAECRELAEEAGWRLIDGRWACPGHVAAREENDA